MKKVYHLKTCQTCQKIIKELGGLEGFEMQNLKEENIDPKMLTWLKRKVGTYEALFSRRSMKYRAWGLHEKDLTEKDYRKYILKEYTFLKRPVIIFEDQVFVGNTRKAVEGAKEAILVAE